MLGNYTGSIGLLFLLKFLRNRVRKRPIILLFIKGTRDVKLVTWKKASGFFFFLQMAFKCMKIFSSLAV